VRLIDVNRAPGHAPSRLAGGLFQRCHGCPGRFVAHFQFVDRAPTRALKAGAVTVPRSPRVAPLLLDAVVQGGAAEFGGELGLLARADVIQYSVSMWSLKAAIRFHQRLHFRPGRAATWCFT
jgi:hypothetical protein